MRTTVEIPDAVHAELKALAAREGRPMKDLVLRGVQTVLSAAPPPTPKKKKKLKLPIIESKQPGGWLHLTNEMIDDLLFP
jgi:hypothetical protein